MIPMPAPRVPTSYHLPAHARGAGLDARSAVPAPWLIRMTERSSRYERLANRHAQGIFLHRGNVESYPALAAPLEKRGMGPGGRSKSSSAGPGGT